MIRENSFNLMCSEVLKILEYCPKSDVNKIPEKLIELLKSSQSKDDQVEIDPNKSIFDQNVCEKTLVMMFIIFNNYWATEDEKKEVDKILKENQIKLNEVRNYEDLFKNNKDNKISKENSTAVDTSTAMVEYEETIIKKIINVIKIFFRN